MPEPEPAPAATVATAPASPAPARWSPADLASPAALAAKFAPAASTALASAREEVRQAVIASAGGPVMGAGAWLVTAPAYAHLSHPAVLAVLLRIVAEMVLGGLFPVLLPLFPLLNWLIGLVRFLPVPDPARTEALADALLALARTAPGALSDPARAGLAALTPEAPDA